MTACVWVCDRLDGLDFDAVAARPCPECEAPARKLCVGGAAGVIVEDGKHPGAKWLDVHEARLVGQESLL